MAVGTPNGNADARRSAENLYVRDLVVRSSIDLVQEIASHTFTDYVPGQRKVINTAVKPVGLLKRFYLHITADLAGQTLGALDRTRLGGANILSNVILTDLNNQVRIQTPGWHLHALATVRRGFPFNGAFAPVINTNVTAGTAPVISGALSAMDLGDNLALMSIPATIAAAGAPSIRWFYELPVSYGDTDLTGSIWANTQNAAMNLQLEVNPDFFVTNAQDPLMAVYQSADADIAGADITTMTIRVYQHVLDQLPVNQQTGQVMLPGMDLSTVYLLNNTDITGLTANVETAIPFANWRQFLSTFVLYDGNNATGFRSVSDVAHVALQSANFTNFFKVDPRMNACFVRNQISADFPDGVHFFNHRGKPIVTQQYGNMELLFQPIAPTSGAHLRVGYESLALQSVMNMAGSIFQG
ncbi:MAG: hypothetical protein ACREBU_02330 [Nitrososphaera sp.]